MCAKGNLCGSCQRAGYNNQQIFQASLCECIQMWRLLQRGESELHEYKYNLRVENGKWGNSSVFFLPQVSKKGGEGGCLVSEILLWKICLHYHNKQKNWFFIHMEWMQTWAIAFCVHMALLKMDIYV